MDVIRFYSVSGEYGCFSNFSPHPIRLKGVTWPTSEHYFQAQKFAGTPDEEEVRRAKSPMIAARMGRSRKRPLRKDWESVKDSIMHEAVLAKFTQHADLREILLGTGEDRRAHGQRRLLGRRRRRLRQEPAGPDPHAGAGGVAILGVGLMSPIVRPETTADHAAIREVNRLAFGREDEARLVDALRDGGYARVSLVAVEDGQVVGHILFSDLPIVTPGGMVPALSLAPMAVIPSHQRRGIGSMLVREGLRACRDAGHRVVVVLGHPEFYPRFGFSAKLAERLRSVYSGPAFMAVELVPGALEGVGGEVRYPPPFGSG